MNYLFLLVPVISFVSGKVYDRCSLAKELKTVHGAPIHQLATWVCIAEHESSYRTYAVGRLGEKGTADHGIFQISDKYWCSPPGKGQSCRLSCSQLEDDDITDDFICAQKIYREHKLISGDGFDAWAVYKPYCKSSKVKKYLKGCFDESYASKPPIYENSIFNETFKFFNTGNAFDQSVTSLPTKPATNDYFAFTKSISAVSSTPQPNPPASTTINFLTGGHYDKRLNVNSFSPISLPLPSREPNFPDLASTPPRSPLIDRSNIVNPSVGRPFDYVNSPKVQNKLNVNSFSSISLPLPSREPNFPDLATTPPQSLSIDRSNIVDPNVGKPFDYVNYFSSIPSPIPPRKPNFPDLATTSPRSSSIDRSNIVNPSVGKPFVPNNSPKVQNKLNVNSFSSIPSPIPPRKSNFPHLATTSPSSSSIDRSNIVNPSVGKPFVPNNSPKVQNSFDLANRPRPPSRTSFTSSGSRVSNSASEKTTTFRPVFVFNGVRWY